MISIDSTVGEGTTVTIILRLPKVEEDFLERVDGTEMIGDWLGSSEGSPKIEALILKAIETVPLKIARLENIVLNGEREELKATLHDLKGFSGNYGMKELYELLGLMEVEADKESVESDVLMEFLNRLKNVVKLIPENYRKELEIDERQIRENRVKVRVMVAEDNEMNRMLVEELLSQQGITPEFAENGKVALEKLEIAEYDLLILDMQMPVMDGLETIRRIRKERRFGSLYVIALTAHAMKGDAEKYLDAGCNDYISKPVDKKEFRQKIDAFVARMGRSEKSGEIKISKDERIKLKSSDEYMDIVSRLIANSKVFNNTEVAELATRLEKLSDTDFIRTVSARLRDASDEYDDEAIPDVVRSLEDM